MRPPNCVGITWGYAPSTGGAAAAGPPSPVGLPGGRPSSPRVDHPREDRSSPQVGPQPREALNGAECNHPSAPPSSGGHLQGPAPQPAPRPPSPSGWDFKGEAARAIPSPPPLRRVTTLWTGGGALSDPRPGRPGRSQGGAGRTPTRPPAPGFRGLGHLPGNPSPPLLPGPTGIYTRWVGIDLLGGALGASAPLTRTLFPLRQRRHLHVDLRHRGHRGVLLLLVALSGLSAVRRTILRRTTISLWRGGDLSPTPLPSMGRSGCRGRSPTTTPGPTPTNTAP